MLVQERAYTRDEFELFLQEHSEGLYELVNGEIVQKMPNQPHGFVIYVLGGALYVFLSSNPIGVVFIESRYGLPDDDSNDYIPDLSFIRHDSKDKPVIRKGTAPYMPDLAVEVQSPGQTDKLMSDKAAYYLANGSRMVWLIYTEKRLIEVLTPTDRILLTEADTLTGGDVLTGFSLPIRELFLPNE